METNGFDSWSFSGRCIAVAIERPARHDIGWSFVRRTRRTWAKSSSPESHNATPPRSERAHIADERRAATRCAADRKSAIIRTFWRSYSHWLVSRVRNSTVVPSWVILSVARAIKQPTIVARSRHRACACEWRQRVCSVYRRILRLIVSWFSATNTCCSLRPLWMFQVHTQMIY